MIQSIAILHHRIALPVIRKKAIVTGHLATAIRLQVTRLLRLRNRAELVITGIPMVLIVWQHKRTDGGRIMLRKSGTEPVIRIMAECKTEDECKMHIESITNLIKEKGYLNG